MRTWHCCSLLIRVVLLEKLATSRPWECCVRLSNWLGSNSSPRQATSRPRVQREAHLRRSRCQVLLLDHEQLALILLHREQNHLAHDLVDGVALLLPESEALLLLRRQTLGVADGLPPGRYTLRAWVEHGKLRKDIDNLLMNKQNMDEQY